MKIILRWKCKVFSREFVCLFCLTWLLSSALFYLSIIFTSHVYFMHAVCIWDRMISDALAFAPLSDAVLFVSYQRDIGARYGNERVHCARCIYDLSICPSRLAELHGKSCTLSNSRVSSSSRFARSMLWTRERA